MMTQRLPVAVLALAPTALTPAVKTATLLELASGDFPAPALFVNCRVKCHEDVPRHIWGLFQALGIQYRWILTRGNLAGQLVTTADLAIDDARETSWMALHEHERDLLEDTMYRRLAVLWSESSPFLTRTSAQQLCAQNVWETLLDAFPSSTSACKRSSLLARWPA
jgi:hypothetical protein